MEIDLGLEIGDRKALSVIASRHERCAQPRAAVAIAFD